MQRKHDVNMHEISISNKIVQKNHNLKIQNGYSKTSLILNVFVLIKVYQVCLLYFLMLIS